MSTLYQLDSQNHKLPNLCNLQDTEMSCFVNEIQLLIKKLKYTAQNIGDFYVLQL